MNDSLIQEFLEYTQMVRGCRPKTAEAYAIDLKVFKAYCTDHSPNVDNPSKAK
jgi:site-specific recombinase XerD